MALATRGKSVLKLIPVLTKRAMRPMPVRKNKNITAVGSGEVNPLE